MFTTSDVAGFTALTIQHGSPAIFGGATVTNSTFLENSDASLGGGGAIRGPLDSGTPVPPVTVTNSTFVGNYSQGQGGAISVRTRR